MYLPLSTQVDSNPTTTYNLTYDAADQLTDAVQTNGSTSVSENHFGYDPLGNRLSERTLTGTMSGQFNVLNQLTAYSTNPTSTPVAGNVSATVPLPPGTNMVSVVAQPADATAAATTKRYQVVTTGPSATTLQYDANGNLTSIGNGQTYAWDAENRLLTITYAGGATSNFTYDALGQRVGLVEKDNTGAVTATRQFIYASGPQPVEERDASGTNVTKRFYPQGEQIAGANYYYTRDHLGSVREMCDSSGTIVSRLSYDMYGKTSVVSGTNLPQFQYTGDYCHLVSGLNLTWYRAYDPNTGRWLSRDPIAERGGLNIYEYVGDDPILFNDPTGEIPFTGHDGYLKVDCSCRGKINMFVVDEHSAPAAPATCGVWVKADGYVMNGVLYKIDGSTAVTLSCSGNTLCTTADINDAAAIFHGSRMPYPVPHGSIGPPPKEPVPGTPEPPINPPPPTPPKRGSGL